MPWPPTIYPPDRANDTVQVNNHPADHNQLSAAVTEIVTKVDAVEAAKMNVGGTTTEPVIFGPSGQQVTLNNGGITTQAGITTTTLATSGAITAGGTFTAAGQITGNGRLRLAETGDASVVSTGHAFQIGADNTFNLAIDNNEIQARNNGAASSMSINGGGGGVTVGAPLTVNGLITGNNGIDTNQALSGGSVASNTWVRAAGEIVSGGSGAPLTTYGARMHPAGQLYAVAGDGLFNSPSVELFRGASADDNGQSYITFHRGLPWSTPSTVGSIRVASSTSVSYSTTSDGRLKTPTGDVDDAVELVSQLGANVYRGEWTADQGGGETSIFLNSQDTLAIVPFAVSGPPDGDPQVNPQQLDHSALVPLLLAAVTQLAERVHALESA